VSLVFLPTGTPIDAIFTTPGIEPTSAGYLPYKALMDSDHRALWIEVPFTSILGHNFPHKSKQEPAAVNPKDPRSVKTYTDWVKKGFACQDNKILQDLAQLKSMRGDMSKLSEVIALHAAISEENKLVCKWAADKTRRTFMGKYAWSPEWQEAKQPIWMWKMVTKKKKGGKVNGKYLKSLMHQCGHPKALHLSIPQLEANLSKAQSEFELACQRDSTLRLQFLDRLATNLAAKNKTTKEAELKKLTNISRQKQQAQRIQKARRKATRQGPGDSADQTNT
jgi:hypothetical protein